jgi:hypothetical protein
MSREEIVGSEALQCFVDVSRHRQTDPVGAKRYIHAQVSIAGGLDGEFVVVSPKSGDKMIGVRLRAVSNAKIVDNQAESYIESVVLKQTGGVGALVVAVFREVRDELKLAQTASLRETVHTFSDLEVDCIVVEEGL